MSEANSALRTGIIKFGYDFNSLTEVTHLWGRKATRLPYSNHFRVPGTESTSVMLLSENGGRGWKNIPHRGISIDSRGWRQIERIDEVDAEATKASLDSGENICIYKKIADECPCNKVDWRTSEITDSEFAGFANRVVEAVLLDEIDYRIDEKTDGSVKVWPGQKLFVSKVVAGGVKVVCLTADANILAAARRADKDGDKKVEFFIPKRDFELGYFQVQPGEAKLEDTFSEKNEDDLIDE